MMQSVKGTFRGRAGAVAPAPSVGVIDALAIPRPDPSPIGIGSELGRSERMILKHWGVAALENLHQLGERMERESAFACAVRALPTIHHPDAARLLSREAPDLMLSAHIFEQSIGRFAVGSPYRGLPTSGSDIVSQARHVNRFSRVELTRAIVDAQSMEPHLRASPLSGLFSLAEISMFKDAQLTAYRARLGVQPGGDVLLEKMRARASQEDEQGMIGLITVQMVERFRALGAPALKLLRHYGAQGEESRWRPVSRDAFCGEIVRSLTDQSGRCFELPPSLLNGLDQVQNGAWRDAHALRAMPTTTSSRTIQNLPRGLQDTERELFVTNSHMVAALSLAAEVARLPESLYQRLVDASSPHSATDGQSIVVESPHVPNSRETPPLDTSVRARRLEHPEALGEVVARARHIEKSLLDEDIVLAQGLFRYVDAMRDSVTGTHYAEIGEQLRFIQQARGSCVELIKLGMLSMPIGELAIENSSDVIKIVQSNADELLRSRIGEGLGRYYASRAWLENYSGFTLPKGFNGTELLSPASLSTRYVELRSLIDDNSEDVTPAVAGLEVGRHAPINADSTSAARAELARADYSRTYFENLLAAGNHVLYRPKGVEVGSGIDGLFIYHDRRDFPASLRPLRDSISDRDDVAYESLFVTAKDRAKGTYMMLLRGMGARQILAGARFSVGTVRESNQHHYDLLRAVDHSPLLGAPVVLDALKRRYIPMLWRLT